MSASKLPSLEPLRSALRSLPSTGQRGFEGLVRDAVQLTVGRRLFLVKSGPQGGLDMGTAPLGGHPGVGVEAKRYAEKRVPLDQLKAKVHDAARSRANLDLLVFAATREIPLNDREALTAVGEALGLGIAFVDWPESTTILPPLAVLCAAAPEALCEKISDASPVKRALRAICADKRFVKAKDQLVSQLTSADMGWATARRQMADSLRHGLVTTEQSGAWIGECVNLLDPSIQRIGRPRLDVALDAWWAEGAGAPAVLLGDEGVGKTWAAFGWWNVRAGPDASGLPLTVVVRASDVSGANPYALVARRLQERTQLRTEDFWERRLRMWLTAPEDVVRVLFIIDGLDQNWTFHRWGELLRCLVADPWRGKAAVLITCRPDHWQNELGGLAEVAPAPRVIPVCPFDDGELDSLLAVHGLARQDFGLDVFPLLRIPRLCQLAIRHRAAIAESGDVTRERLVYEDWKDRLSRRGRERLGLTDTEFTAFIAQLGDELRQASDDTALDGLSRKDLFDRLGRDSGKGPESLYATVSEIVDGRWLEAVPETPNRFRVRKEVVPFALALALVYDLKLVSEETGMKARLAEFMEPLRGQDLAVDLLRAAATVALADPRHPRPIRRLMLDAWLRSRNFRLRDFEAFWRLVPLDLEVFLAAAQETWLHRHVGENQDEILVKALANAAEKWPKPKSQVADWCAAWLGTHWDDPLMGMVLGYNSDQAGVAERACATRERRTSWDTVAHRLNPAVPLRADNDAGVPWLACRVISLLSYWPDLLPVRALVGWALTRAIMRSSHGQNQVAWLLRLALDDTGELAAAVEREAGGLCSLSHPVAVEAGRLLREALATPDSHSATPPSLRVVQSPAPSPEPLMESATGALAWDAEAELARPRCKKVPLAAAESLRRFALDPGLEISKASVGVLADASANTQVEALWNPKGRTLESAVFELAEPVLARWAPTALADLRRRSFAWASQQDDEQLRVLCGELPACQLVLTGGERGPLAQRGTAETLDAGVQSILIAAALDGKTSAEQIALLSGIPGGPVIDEVLKGLLQPPSESDFAVVAPFLDANAPAAQLKAWLWYLDLVDIAAMPEGYAPVLELVRHVDDEVRWLALALVHRSKDPELLRAVVQSGWKAAAAMVGQERFHGSLALIEGRRFMEPSETLKRIDPQALGILASKTDSMDADLDAFADDVRRRIENDLHPVQGRSRNVEHWPCLERAAEVLVARRGEQVLTWLAPFLDPLSQPRVFMLFEEFPYVHLCRALLLRHPVEGAALWRRLSEINKREGLTSERLSTLPIEAPDSPAVLALRDRVVDEAHTDEQLTMISGAVARSGRQGWLLERIRADLTASSSGRIARGLALSGLLDVSEQADALWRLELSSPPGSGWLAAVHEWAHGLFIHNQWAHHWLECFLRERGPDRAFGSFVLFLECVDRRAGIWAPRRVRQELELLPSPWRLHWSVRVGALEKAIQESDRKRRETLFGDPVPRVVQWPWR